ncbi:YcjF family protein [Paracoccus tegillarcae]|uniref:TIGR01620 family protein n=1 Tax=Paracoccus tegillarcae TaxID=1529068 RepID=A0A2K9EMN5_9RHOB|nr:YcjF family protein [Paracoccus tegillarcae]AUH32885.1 TIGR01620 family protein [Paracoccus tegillarcae]
MSNDETPRKRGPVLIELGEPTRDARPDPRPFAGEEPQAQTRAGQHSSARSETRDDSGPNPADAPPIDDGLGARPRPRTMEMVTRLVGRGPSPLTRFFINTGVALFTFLLAISALNFINRLMNAYPILGWVGIALFAAFTLAALLMAFREYRAWARFARIDSINREAGTALANGDLAAARKVAGQLQSLYAKRPELDWARQNLKDRQADAMDAETLLVLTETNLMAPLDQQARREIEAASRTVAAATALIPLALADVMAALAANLRMIRRMAEIYGGRAGAVGGWRLARTVMTHLIATGAVAAGDDLIHTMAGGGVLAKVSRRFGEGVVNGALTARVGIAAMEVCRPMPFIHQPRPKVGNLVTRGLRGLFGGDDAPPDTKQ